MSQNFALGLRLLPQVSQNVICNFSGAFCTGVVVSRVKSVGVLTIVLRSAMIFRASSTVMGADASEVSAIFGGAGVSSFLVTLGVGGDTGVSP